MSRASELIRLLYLSAESIDGNPDRCHISGLEHSLRVATLATRHTNDIQFQFAALVHDLARPLSDPYHGEVIAEIVRDMVDEDMYFVLKSHGQFQAAHIHETELSPLILNAEWYDDAMALCAWEIASFAKDWKHATMDIETAKTLIETVCDGRD